jgi:hypothetical protein
MPKRRSKTESVHLLRFVHLQAVVFLVMYYSVSQTIFVASMLSKNPWVNFFVPYTFGVLSGIGLLYLLNHDECFHFMKDVEKREKSKEKKLIKKYMHHGKVFATLIIATVAGPMFAALSVRLLLQKYKHPFALLAVGNIFSTILTVGLVKGVVLGLMH